MILRQCIELKGVQCFCTGMAHGREGPAKKRNNRALG